MPPIWPIRFSYFRYWFENLFTGILIQLFIKHIEIDKVSYYPRNYPCDCYNKRNGVIIELLHYNAANHTPKNLLAKVKRKADKILSKSS